MVGRGCGSTELARAFLSIPQVALDPVQFCSGAWRWDAGLRAELQNDRSRREVDGIEVFWLQGAAQLDPLPSREPFVMRFLSSLLVLQLFAGDLCLPAKEPSTSPLRYDCHFTKRPPHIDGKLDDAAWKEASWTSDFMDIEGGAGPAPRFRTRVKMLWDHQYLYIAAELEEPDVKASLTEHDSVIFHDNDFEVFLKPVPESPSYYEFEMNALNTGWDLYLPKPYKLGGLPDNSWDIEGLRTAVAVEGTLNHSSDRDRGWTLEIAYPLRAFRSRQNVPPPGPGTEWRINFSRVEWTAGQARENNWVWSPQGIVDMHVPERWGYLRFR